MSSAIRRIKKQITYGLGFLVVLGGVIWLITLVVTEPAPVVATPTPTAIFQAIDSEEASFIQHNPASTGENYTVDIVVRLRNPNPRAGVTRYALTATLFDAQQRQVKQEEISTYLLPGAVSYAAKVNVAVPLPVARIQVTPPAQTEFTTVPASVSLPSFSTRLLDRVQESIGNKVVDEQKGVVTNTSALDWQFVEIIGVALKADGQVVGVGQTFVGELKVGEQREFTLQWPAASNIARVIVLPTTNIYRQENIVRQLGNPELLR